MVEDSCGVVMIFDLINHLEIIPVAYFLNIFIFHAYFVHKWLLIIITKLTWPSSKEFILSALEQGTLSSLPSPSERT